MNPRHKSASGLTLLEILIVVLIVSLLAGIALLSFDINNPQRIPGREAERLRLILAAAAEQALIQGAEYGLRLGEKEYQVLLFDGQAQQWRQSDEPMFQLHLLPDPVELEVEMEQQLVLPAQVIDADTRPGLQEGHESPGLIPQILMLSSGELTPFDIFLNTVDGSRMYRISGDGIRPIRLEKVAHAGQAAY